MAGAEVNSLPPVHAFFCSFPNLSKRFVRKVSIENCRSAAVTFYLNMIVGFFEEPYG